MQGIVVSNNCFRDLEVLNIYLQPNEKLAIFYTNSLVAYNLDKEEYINEYTSNTYALIREYAKYLVKALRKSNLTYDIQPNKLYFIKDKLGNFVDSELTYDSLLNIAFDIERRHISNYIQCNTTIKNSKKLLAHLIQTRDEYYEVEKLYSMGYKYGDIESMSDNELRKAKYVVNIQYSGRDCASYGKCPTCGELVVYGMYDKDVKCRVCKQTLHWGL